MYDRFEICRLIQRFMVASLGFPAHRASYVDRLIDRPRTSLQELQEYQETRLPIKSSKRRILIAWSAIFFIKTVLFLRYIFYHVNTLNLGSNVQVNTTFAGSKEYSFLCLTTNCTRLKSGWSSAKADDHQQQHQGNAASIEDQLGGDFFNLPVLFALCQPILSQFQDSLQYLGELGMIGSAMLAVCICISGLVLPLIQILKPTSALFIMFIMAPDTTRQVVLDRIKEIGHDIHESYKSYCLMISRRNLNHRQLYQHSMNPKSMQMGAERQWNVEMIQFGKLGPDTAKQTIGHHTKDEHKISDRYAWDCLSATRSIWWRYELAKSLVESTLLNITIFLAFLVLYVLANHLSKLEQDNLRAITVDMARSNCSLWFGDKHSDDEMEIVHLDELDLGWTMWFNLQFIGITWPVLCLTVYCTYFYSSNVELLVWLNETKFQLEVCVEFAREIRLRLHLTEGRLSPNSVQLSARNIHQRQVASGLYKTNRNDSHWFRMQPIRWKYKSLTRVRFSMLLQTTMGLYDTTTSSEFQYKLAVEEFVSKFWSTAGKSDEMNLNSLVEMMEKSYISHRVFVEHVHLYAPSIAMMIVLMNILNYSYVCNAIWYVRNIRGFEMVASGTIMAGFGAAIFFIILPSNFHAKAKKLQHIMWSLIAETTGPDNDLRIEHVRLLWLKYLMSVNMDGGGIGLKAFNIRITYVNIIQMLIWTATILVVAVRM